MEKRILIVDDEEQVLRLLKVSLQKAGFEVETACNGKEAIGTYVYSLHREPLSAIVLDVKMPDIDGVSVLEIIRSEEKQRGVAYGSGIPIIMLTGYKSHYMESFDMGCDDYMVKPVKPRDLIEKIKEKIG